MVAWVREKCHPPHPFPLVLSERAGPSVIRVGELGLSLTSSLTQSSRLCTHLGCTLELTLLLGMQVSQPRMCESRRVDPPLPYAPPPTATRIEVPEFPLGKIVEQALVV